VNNALDQRNDVGDLRYTTPDFSAYFNLSGDDQHLRCRAPERSIRRSGSSSSSPTEEVPIRHFDYGNSQNANATGGFTKTLWNGVDLVVDGDTATSSNNLLSWVRQAVIPSSFLRQRDSANMVAHSQIEHQEFDIWIAFNNSDRR